MQPVTDLETPFGREATLAAVNALMGMWLRKHEPHCSWCGTVFEKVEDFAQYAEFCADLNKLWPRTFKQQPPSKVFCNFCAVGAIEELITGKRYDASVPF